MARKLNFSKFDCEETKISYWETLIDHTKTCKTWLEGIIPWGGLKWAQTEKKKALRE